MTPKAEDVKTMAREMRTTASGEAPRSMPNATIPTPHRTTTCMTPRYAPVKNFPKIIDSRRTPFVSRRSSVWFRRSRAMASALNAAAKKMNMVR